MIDTILTHGDGFDAWRMALVALSLVVSFLYLSIVDRPARPLRTGLKTASIAALVPLPLLLLGSADSIALIALALALAFGSLGDYFLALKGSERDFKRGVFAFLIGHLFYLVVMVPRISAPTSFQIAGMALLAVMAVGVCWWIGPKLGKYKMPIWSYMGVISLMALAALSVPAPLAGVGALLFVFSDAVIVVNQFRQPVPYRGPIVWVTYYVGQILLAGSLLTLIQ
ncbi:MAG: lysoplasmalogenase [Parvibaculum sp.]|nr:lysoplasmalogenase [Parvibaculum sp.]